MDTHAFDRILERLDRTFVEIENLRSEAQGEKVAALAREVQLELALDHAARQREELTLLLHELLTVYEELFQHHFGDRASLPDHPDTARGKALRFLGLLDDEQVAA